MGSIIFSNQSTQDWTLKLRINWPVLSAFSMWLSSYVPCLLVPPHLNCWWSCPMIPAYWSSKMNKIVDCTDSTNSLLGSPIEPSDYLVSAHRCSIEPLAWLGSTCCCCASHTLHCECFLSLGCTVVHYRNV